MAKTWKVGDLLEVTRTDATASSEGVRIGDRALVKEISEYSFVLVFFNGRTSVGHWNSCWSGWRRIGEARDD